MDLKRPAAEWPTLALALLIYSSWLALTWFHASLPAWLLWPLGAWFVCWHSSLQHEVLHGHPTRWRGFNRFLAYWPLALWLPYERYRMAHLIHHHDERLTDPLDDPESRYWTNHHWQALGRLGQALVRAQGTLLGRLTIGPFWAITQFFWSDARAILAGDKAIGKAWLWHLPGLALTLLWIKAVCGMSLVTYVFAIAIPGTSLMLIRSFAEHLAESEVARRTAIVENSWFFGVLFLFNNLHAAHHQQPTLAWYRLPGWYKAHRAALIAANGGLLYRGYAGLFRRFFLRPYEQPLHPREQDPQRWRASPAGDKH